MVAEEWENLELNQLEFVDCDLNGESETRLGEELYEDGAVQVFSMAGLARPRTMRMLGIMKGHTITIFVDSGSSHNSVSASLVSRMKLNQEKVGRLGVQFGDGRRQELDGVCRELNIALPGYDVVGNCYVFALGEVDVILGVAWLATLGDVRTNCDNMMMSFIKKGSTVVLKGDPTLCRGLIEFEVGEFEPETVLDSRISSEGDIEVQQVLIKWLGQSSDDATWMDIVPFQQQFPSFNLGDKVVLKGDELLESRFMDVVGDGLRPKRACWTVLL